MSTKGMKDAEKGRVLQALRESEELHRITLSSISDAVFLADDQGKFIYICPNVNVIFGYSYPEVRRFKNISRILGKGFFKLSDLKSKGELANIELDIRDKSKHKHVLLVNVKRVSIKGATVLYTCRDITEKKQAEEALKNVRHELEIRKQLDVLKTNFVSNVSHELKSPLGLVSGYVDALSEMIADPAQAELVAVIQSNVGRLNRIVTDILDLSRLESGKVRFHMVKHDLNDTLRSVIADFEPRIREKRLSVKLKLMDESAARCDVERVRQVFANLIENAIKFSLQNGRITISSKTVESGVEVAIADEGPGVAKHDEERIFEKFYRTEDAVDSQMPGTGLGLAIVKEIVLAHGGKIFVGPGSKTGSVFHVILPARK